MEIQTVSLSDEDKELVSLFIKEKCPDAVDFNFLMPIVEKIESFGCSFEIFKTPSFTNPKEMCQRCSIEPMSNWTLPRFEEWPDSLVYITDDSKIIAVWLAVNEFIKWYNRHVK